MPRETFHRELQVLQEKVLIMGSLVEKALLDAVQHLKQRNMDGSRRVIAGDQEINRLRFEIEGEALILIATQAPMAVDLRNLAAIIEIAAELERIGDYAKGIGKINLLIGQDPLIKPLIDIPRMAEKACDMLRRALQAFINHDCEAAYAIPKDDDEVDALYNQVYRELMTFIIADPKVINQVNYLLWAAHNLERAADRVNNICERVIFTVTGELMEIKTSYDEML